MWLRIRVDGSNAKRQAGETTRKPGRRASQQPQFEALEDRQLLTATLQSISNLTVPAQQGYTVPLLADSGQTTPQTFTVTSSNPDIAASIISGQFWTLGVSYTDPNTPANSFTGDLTFQLFNDLTPNTVSMINEFTNDNYYVDTGKYFPRIVTNFAETGFYVVQGGSNSLTGSGSSGQPGTPFANENLQQLPLSGVNQIAMANSGGTDSNDTQFFINTGSLNSALGYGYTVFGQMLTGTTTLGLMTKIPVMDNTVTGEDSQPVNPLTITSATLSTTNPNGTLLLDTTQAKEGETSTITVTAHEGTSTMSESFVVTVGAYGGPASPTINFRPFANATTGSVGENTPGQVQLDGQSGYPNTATPSTLSYRAAQSAGARHDQRLRRVDRDVHIHSGQRIHRLGYASVPGDGDRAREYSRDHGEQPRGCNNRGWSGKDRVRPDHRWGVGRPAPAPVSWKKQDFRRPGAGLLG